MVSLAVLTGCGAQAAEQAAEPTPSAKAANTPPTSPTAGAAKDSATTPTETDTESAAADSAAAVLATLPVKGRAPMTGYDRDRFGQAWLDADRNGCDTRNDILGEFLTAATYKPGSGHCAVLEGDLDDPYTGTDIHFVYGNGALVDIDHVVALGNVWVTGGFGWGIEKRAAIANDPMNLLPVDASANRQKGDGDAATWLPSNKRYRCAYVARQIGVKEKYNLWVTAPEKGAMEGVLSTCPGQTVPEDSGAPVRVTLNITDPGAAPARSNTQPGTQATGQPEGGSVYYENCEAARAAGAAPVRRGDPGYGSHLDRDGDGSACE
jgi:Excalibur calcium-binding domain/Protein of unknown function (DUF1524)